MASPKINFNGNSISFLCDWIGCDEEFSTNNAAKEHYITHFQTPLSRIIKGFESVI
jgi:uncharacterized Zn-finger protein